jgi:hypothetical protein
LSNGELTDALKQVARIAVKKNNSFEDAGTGAIVGPGAIITAGHVVADRSPLKIATAIRAYLPDGRNYEWKVDNNQNPNQKGIANVFLPDQFGTNYAYDVALVQVSRVFSKWLVVTRLTGPPWTVGTGASCPGYPQVDLQGKPTHDKGKQSTSLFDFKPREVEKWFDQYRGSGLLYSKPGIESFEGMSGAPLLSSANRIYGVLFQGQWDKDCKAYRTLFVYFLEPGVQKWLSKYYSILGN